MHNQIASLKLLKDGWLNGQGVVIDQEGLIWLEQRLTGLSQDLSKVYLYPTSEGGVSLEYDFQNNKTKDSISAILNLKDRTCELFACDCEWGLHLDLNEDSSWTRIFSYFKYSGKEEKTTKPALPFKAKKKPAKK
jgi:hypothetical protein